MLTIAAVFIGLNKESKAAGLGELDQDIRRRTWCILETWDWYFSRLVATTASSDTFTGRFLRYSLVRCSLTGTVVMLSPQMSTEKRPHHPYTT